MLDGSNEWQVFRHVIFPSLKPINVVVAVITVIEALRAFDIIYVLNTPRKTEVLSILTTNNLLGEGGGNVGRGLGRRHRAARDVHRVHHPVIANTYREDGPMTAIIRHRRSKPPSFTPARIALTCS